MYTGPHHLTLLLMSVCTLTLCRPPVPFVFFACRPPVFCYLPLLKKTNVRARLVLHARCLAAQAPHPTVLNHFMPLQAPKPSGGGCGSGRRINKFSAPPPSNPPESPRRCAPLRARRRATSLQERTRPAAVVPRLASEMPELPPLPKPLPVPRRWSNPLCAVVALSPRGSGHRHHQRWHSR